MSDTIHYNQCPACSSANIAFVLKAKDETVSHQQFEIWQCKNCTLRFTQDVPDENNISSYYQSSEYISHSNTSKGVVNKLYHTVRSITLQTKRKLIEKNIGKKTANLVVIFPTNIWKYDVLDYFPFDKDTAKSVSKFTRFKNKKLAKQ